MVRKMAVRPLHSAWLIMAGALGVLIGAVLAKYLFSGYLLSGNWMLIVFFFVGYGVWRQRVWCLVLLVVAGLIAGYGRASHVVLAEQATGQYHGRIVTLQGTVAEDVAQSKGATTMVFKDISIDGVPSAGRIWVSSAQDDRQVMRSDRVTIHGMLQPGFATFAGTMMQARIVSVQHRVHSDVALEVRDWFASGVTQVIDHPEVDLGLGFVVGEKRSLPTDILDALKIVGLTHVIVASGYNLTILVRLARRLLAKYSKFAALAGSAGLVFSFVMITGVSPSMSRAGIVTGLSLAAWYYGRTIHPLILLTLAAAITVYINPTYAWGDAGWLLSFTAFAGVLIVAPLTNAYFFGKDTPGTIWQILIETTAAQLVTMPVIMYLFGQFSVIALLANLLILPLIPFTMLLVFISGIMTLVHVPLAIVSIVSTPAQWILHYMIWLTEQLASVSWASLQVTIPLAAVVAMYAGIVAVVLYLRRATRLSLGGVSVIE